MKDEVSEPEYPWKTMTVGFATSMKSRILDTFLVVKTNGYTGFDLRKRKMLLQHPVSPRKVGVSSIEIYFLLHRNVRSRISKIDSNRLALIKSSYRLMYRMSFTYRNVCGDKFTLPSK
jgi:hypothetical protein